MSAFLFMVAGAWGAPRARTVQTPPAAVVLSPEGNRRVIITLPSEPPSRVRCSLDADTGEHAELTWDPEVSGRLSQSVLLPGPAGAKWALSCSASPLPRTVQVGGGTEAVRGNVDVAWKINSKACATSTSCIDVQRRDVELKGDALVVNSYPAGSITVAMKPPPTLAEAKAGLTMSEGGKSGGRSLDLGAEVPEIVRDTLTLLAEVAYDRAKANGLGLVSQQLTNLVCERMKLPSTALPPELGGLADTSLLPETCELVGRTKLLDLVAAGQDVLLALASDFVSFGFNAVESLLVSGDREPAPAVTRHVVPLLKAVQGQAADFVSQGRAPSSQEAQVLLTNLAVHDWTQGTPTIEECGIELGFAALSTCYAGGACDARALTDILHRPDSYFTIEDASCKKLLPELAAGMPELPGLVARMVVVVEPPAGTSAREQAAAVAGAAFDIAELLVDVDAQRRRGLALDRVPAFAGAVVPVGERSSGREMLALLDRLTPPPGGTPGVPLADPSDVWALDSLLKAFPAGQAVGFTTACETVRTKAGNPAHYKSLPADLFGAPGSAVCKDPDGLSQLVSGEAFPGGNDVERAGLARAILTEIAKSVDTSTATDDKKLWLANGSRAVRSEGDDKLVEALSGWFSTTTAISAPTVAANACARLLRAAGGFPGTGCGAADVEKRLRSLSPEAQDKALTAALLAAADALQDAQSNAANAGSDPTVLAWSGWVSALDGAITRLHRARAMEWFRLLPDLEDLVVAGIRGDPEGVLSNGSALANAVLERVLEVDQAHVTLDPKARKQIVTVGKAVERFTPIVGVLASNASLLAQAAADPSQAEALREARKQAIEALIDGAGDRRGRDGDVVVSLGANPGFYVQLNDRDTSGASLADIPVALPMGVAVDVLPNPGCRSRGGSLARPAGARCGAWRYLGFHAQLSPIELANLLDTSADDPLYWNDFLIIGGQAGLAIGVPANTFVLGLDVRYQPFAITNEAPDNPDTEPTKGAVSASLFATYYVAFFNLN